MLPLFSKPSGKHLESCIRKALHTFHMIEGDYPLGVALSGGKDSLTLLHMLKKISGRGFPPFPLHAFHVSGSFSCGAGVTTGHLQQVCDDLSIPLTVLESNRKLEELECYSCSRERRSLLFQAAKKNGIETLAFGHHQDDNVVTLLLNLLKKGEFAGTLPKIRMQKYGVTIIRPLIYVSEESIKSYSQGQGYLRVTCRCPVGQTSMRRRLTDFLTQIEGDFPDLWTNLNRASLTHGSNKAADIGFES